MAKSNGRICFSAPSQTKKQLDDLQRTEGLRRGELLRAIIRDAHRKAAEKK